ncbi:mannitol 1-phosphate dehydrogenase [Trematosphaeria pertusa]|uniref:Mannitol 1-phosphate dehydrogenase n=1 Tax=Trematosphaeria pertusa TaxID=390896 RepID=A0A6A6I1J5_9PLEO|nr:mannitol 1-phosphate dehydrogenase [Trematosphaeria pertusa]KAF2244156.1 mannitol 1-phosphate dehydrogenase [Trematosphaeria pertusa]
MTSSGNSNAATFQNDPALPIAIVGGGLGGLALAIGLLKHGIHIHIFEAAPVFSEIGAGVTFGANATRALGLIDEALLEGYKKHATFNENREHDDTFASLRWGMDERKDGGKKAGELMWHLVDKWHPEFAKQIGVRARSCIHRARLLDVLVSLVPEGTTSFGKSFEGVEEQPDGTLRLHFVDGTTATASALIGCDGIKSKVREIVCDPAVQASYAGEYAFRAMVPKAEAERALGPELARNGQIYCGYGAYMINYPVEHGDFTNMVAIPLDPDKSWDQDEWTVPTTKDEFVRYFEGWFPPLVDLIQRYCLPSKWALFNLRHSAPYCRGRMCLLGDSAHATTPHMGAGAGMAMEDAYILSNLIASMRGSASIEAAFRAYDAVRRPRTQQLVENSLNAGVALDLTLPGVGDDTDALKEWLETRYRWLWHEDLEAQLEKAKKLL